jgi:hypothetical protein
MSAPVRQEFGTPLGSARALLGLADAERLDGQLDTARRHFDGALRCCLEYHDRDGVAQSHLGLGDVAAAAGDQALLPYSAGRARSTLPPKSDWTL